MDSPVSSLRRAPASAGDGGTRGINVVGTSALAFLALTLPLGAAAIAVRRHTRRARG